MPRKNKHRSDGPDYPKIQKDVLESGTAIPISSIPEDLRKELHILDAMEAEEEALAKQEADKVTQASQAAVNPPKPVEAPKTPAPPSFTAPEKEPFDVSWNPIVGAAPNQGENFVSAAFMPAQKYMTSNPDERRFLSWVVTETRISTARDSVGRLTAVVAVKAMLMAVTVMQVSTPDKGKEPFLNNTHLIKEPVEILLPMWLFPPAKQRNPGAISLDEATSALIALFSGLPTEIIKPAPLPREIAALPQWLREKAMQKGPPKQ